MQKKPQVCERVGCGRRSYDILTVEVQLKRMKLCVFCRALLLDLADQAVREETNPLKKIAWWIEAKNQRRSSGRSRQLERKYGVFFWYPWKNHHPEEDNL